MINSMCGSMGSMKRENSCTELVQSITSPKDHQQSKNNMLSNTPTSTTTISIMDQQITSSLSPPSLDLTTLKIELDRDVDVQAQSPDTAMWHSLLFQSESTSDVMMMSPSTGVSAGKGKGLSPLHKVFSSVNNQYNQHPENFSVPAIEDLLLDYHGFVDDTNNTNNSIMTNCGSFCDLASEDVVGVTLSQQLEQERQRDNNNNNNNNKNNNNLMNSVPFGMSNYLQQDDEQDSGLQLVHLLLACAESVAKEEYMAARRHLRELNRIVNPLGDSMHRVASCFTEALSARLASALSSKTPPPLQPNSLETLKIYQIVYQACPYIKFAHFTANQAIFEAFEAEDRVHVIDLDILQGYQWPAFMQALSARHGGAPFLRITGVGPSLEAVRETGRCLADLARSLHVPFEFHAVGERLEDLSPNMFHRHVGEALAVNSVNRLHRIPPACLPGILSMVRDQAPNIVTVVEQEASHNGPYFLGRFLEALHYYSAIFDSLDATFPAESAQRMKVEQYIFAREIRNIVACEGAERTKRHERLDRWRKLMEGTGFRGVALSANAVSQSKILLSLYSCDGYRLTEDRGCLLLGWQDRPLIAASAWRC